MIDHYGCKVTVKFNKHCLKQPNNLTYDYVHKANVYVVYELGASSSSSSDPTLKNCLFGAVTLTKNIDIGPLVVELDLIVDQPFHFQVVDLVKMY